MNTIKTNEWLASLSWDGTERLVSFISDHLKAHSPCLSPGALSVQAAYPGHPNGRRSQANHSKAGFCLFVLKQPQSAIAKPGFDFQPTQRRVV